jgi:putative transposase
LDWKLPVWTVEAGVNWHYIDPRNRCRTPSSKPLNGRLRDEFLNETLFTSLMQARVALQQWQRDYNTVRPHSRIGWLTPTHQPHTPANFFTVPRHCAL